MTMYLPLPLDELASHLRDVDGNFRRQWRLVMEFLELFRHESSDVQQGLIEGEPLPVDAHWDAFLAGLAEFVAQREGLRVPEWALAPQRRLVSRWFIVDVLLPGRNTLPIQQFAIASCPEPFRSRGVFLEPNDLEVA
jgi:hypothetical protein